MTSPIKKAHFLTNQYNYINDKTTISHITYKYLLFMTKSHY